MSVAKAARPAAPSTLQHIAYVLRENPVTLIAFAMFAVLVLAAVLGPSLVPHDPYASDAARALQPPSAAHWFGTDNLGRDVFSRVVVATRLDLTISVVAVMLSFVVGSALGANAGYWGGGGDGGRGRVLDPNMAIPQLVQAKGIVAALG
ncbi:MAG: ABC transporter permease, partial [Pseudomonadota bacterium]